MVEPEVNYMSKSESDILVTIYSKDDCIWCDKAITLANGMGYMVEVFSIEEKENLEVLKSRLPDVRTVPQIWIGDDYIGGYENFYNEVVERG